MIFSYENKPYWQDINTLYINRLKPRAFFVPFRDVAKAKSNALPHISDTVTMLDGEWQCRYFKSAMTIREEDIYCNEGYKKTIVPSCWQADGLELPAYINVAFPIPGDPPNVPYENPCVIYKRTFTIKKEETCLLTFLGVSSAFSVYVNGKFVGYSEGSHNCSEFDVTDFVLDGQNSIAVLCFKWCNGSYFECQDMFRNNGIFRSVFLTHLPKSYVYDVFIKAKIEDDKGRVYVNLNVVGKLGVVLSVEDSCGNIICQKDIGENAKSSIRSVISMEKPKAWSAETPNVYYLVITTNTSGEQRVIRQPFGFKTVEINKGVFLFNGKPIKIYGVNHHDTHPDRLFALSIEDMEKDIALMKKININAIRFSHYPPHPYMLELCDKEGFYVIDEADAECHGELFMREGKNFFSNDPIWKNTLWDRVERLFERDKNHPSVIMWSLGNESGSGKNHIYSYKNLKKKIFASVVHYEDTHTYEAKVSDVRSFMYSTPTDLKKFIDSSEIPVYLCEYAHSMGVGPGGVKEYIDLFLSEKRMMGGCIWEWAEHSIRQNGQFKYGGDNGEYVHDGNFCVDGMMSPDREFTPSAYEVMNAYRPIRSRIEGNTIRFKSGYLFKSVVVNVVFTVISDGIPVYQKEEKIRFDADKEKVVLIPPCKTEGEAFLNVDYYEDGEKIGFEQHAISKKEWSAKKVATGNKINLSETDSEIIVFGEEVTVRFDKITNTVSSIIAYGEEFINQNPQINRYTAYSDYLKGFTYNIYRYGIDNDRNIISVWENYRLSDLWNNILDRDIVKEYDKVIIRVSSTVSAPKVSKTFGGEIVYTIYADGTIGIQSTLIPACDDLPQIPRFGLKFEMPEAFSKVNYYGYGERENYPDFLESARIGVYSCAINGLSYDYIKPQEGGERIGIRWFEMVNEKSGVALEISADKSLLGFHATNYDVKDFITVRHNYELEKKNTVCVTVDGFYGGIGSNSCGPLPFDKYRFVVDSPRTFSFLIKAKKI